MPTRRRLAASLPLAIGLLTGCAYQEIDGVGTRTMDDEQPPQSDLAGFDGCSEDTLNRWKVSGEITNNTESAATYEVVIAFYDGDVRLDERSEWIRDLRSGETGALGGSWWIDEPERVTDCRVTMINRFS